MANPFQILQALEDTRHGNRLTYPIAYLLLVAFCALRADYILCVKSNQRGTLEEIEALFFLQRQQEHGKLSLHKIQQMNADMKPSQLIAALDF